MFGISKKSLKNINKCITDYPSICDFADMAYKLNNENINLFSDIRKLERENAILEKTIDDIEDTEIIKYNGKLFKITETSHFKSEDCPDTLSIDAVAIYPEDE